MLQRLQTLFLCGILFLTTALFFVEIWEQTNLNPGPEAPLKTTETGTLSLNSLTIIKAGEGQTQLNHSTFLLQVIAGVSILLTIVIIFLYKNRLLQIRMVNLLNLLLAGLLTALIFEIQFAEKQLSGTIINKSYEIGTFLPAISIILGFFANKYIRKDEKLVRSMDRIR
ncbi:MAG: hypothetical protein A3H98_13385 [Bacteroidetes bacterium RIFCSPLOWO2_02_FULL_36_8]|nr:MAG: hypothetical protein A3H98_13385 [Bacteroidetes bacterium RIFCSPLOWO2_02_FULL_36_8]OFY70179.1 MAG: hypothetical protein A3G23_08500 [Bacteroidetes bacterium RIFCSPLOWO2_12_FULL_37_12]